MSTIRGEIGVGKKANNKTFVLINGIEKLSLQGNLWNNRNVF